MWGELRRVLVRRPLPADAGALGGVRVARGSRRRGSAGGARGALRPPRGGGRGGRGLRARSGQPGRGLHLRPDARRSGGCRAVAPRQGRQAPRAGGDRRRARGLPGSRSRDGSRLRRPSRAATRVWLDEATLLVGIGYRTNPAALDSLRGALPGTEVIAFDLPHWNGAAEVMHLMSLISPLDRDLALVYPRIAPTRLMWLLAECGIEVVEVPDEEFETMGPNVLALGPRRALALEGNDETRRRMEREGRRRRDVPGRRDLAQRRRRADLPHPPAAADA